MENVSNVATPYYSLDPDTVLQAVESIGLVTDGPFFVDMDDCQSAPAIQDLWMLLSGDTIEMGQQLSDVIEGYRINMGGYPQAKPKKALTSSSSIPKLNRKHCNATKY